jgi:hypothetical protein
MLEEEPSYCEQVAWKGIKFLFQLATVALSLPLKSAVAQQIKPKSQKYNFYYLYYPNEQVIIAPNQNTSGPLDRNNPEPEVIDKESSESEQKNQEKKLAFAKELKNARFWNDLKTREEREKENELPLELANLNQIDEEKLIRDIVNQLDLTEAEKEELLLLLSLAIFSFWHYLKLLQKLKGFVALRGGNRRNGNPRNGNPPNGNGSRSEYYRKLKSKRRKIDLLSYIVYIIGYIQYIFQIIVYNFKKILKLLKGNKKALAVILSLFFTLLALKYSKDIAALFPLKNFLINSVKTGGESVIPQHPKLDPGRAEKLRQELREKMPHLFKDGKSRKKDFQEHPYTDSAPKNPVRKGKGKKGKGKK